MESISHKEFLVPFKKKTFVYFKKTNPDTKIVVSYKNTNCTPENLVVILEQLQEFPADIYKIETFAQSCVDTLRMLCFLKESADNVVGACTGEKGVTTFILSKVFK